MSSFRIEMLLLYLVLSHFGLWWCRCSRYQKADDLEPHTHDEVEMWSHRWTSQIFLFSDSQSNCTKAICQVKKTHLPIAAPILHVNIAAPRSHCNYTSSRFCPGIIGSCTLLRASNWCTTIPTRHHSALNQSNHTITQTKHGITRHT
jgi:hypothetical protein